MNLLLPGMYMSADTALHRLDPRVKIAAALLLMTIPFAAGRLAQPKALPKSKIHTGPEKG